MKKRFSILTLAFVGALTLASCELVPGGSSAQPSTPGSSQVQPSQPGSSQPGSVESSVVVVPSSSATVVVPNEPVVVYSEDFANVTSVSDDNTQTLWLDSSSKGSVTIDGNAVVEGATADTTLWINLSGLDNGQVTIDFDFALGGVQGSWTFFQLFGTSEIAADAEVFAFRTAKDNDTKETYIGLRADKNQSLASGFDTRLNYQGSITDVHHATITVDTVTGEITATVTINGATHTGTVKCAISEIKGLKFMAKSGKKIAVDNVSVSHVQGSFAEVQAIKLANLATAYANYNAADYTANYASVTEAYNTGVAALNTATDFAGLNAAYTAAIEAMAAVLSDADIANAALTEAKNAAIAQLDAKVAELKATYNYTADELGVLTATYNTCVSAINDSLSGDEVNELLPDCIAELELVPHTGDGSVTEVVYEMNANNLEVKAYNDTVTVADFFKLVGIDGKSKVTTNNKSIDGIDFTQRYQFGGKTTAAAGYITFTVDKDCTLVVYAMSGSNGTERPIMVWNDAELKNLVKEEANDGSAIGKLSVDLTAGTYYIGSTAGAINVYGVYVTIVE